MVSRASKMAYEAQGASFSRWQAAPTPERPAPTIRTSTCSTVTCLSGGRGGEFVDQRSVVAEEGRPPLLDECRGLSVIGVEIGAVVVPQLPPDRLRHEGGATQE